MSTPPPLILIVGMHRSGTSLLGSILQELGVAMPGPLIPGDAHNPEGYFERADITALQEELLIDLGRWWPGPEGVLPLPQGWLQQPRSQRAARCLKRLLAADQQAMATPWAIKDPRTSLLLPLWRQVAAELQQPLKLLLAVRDPAEVCASLVGRDGGPAGMTSQRAQQLWIRHHQQVLADGANLPQQVLSYTRWFQQPEAQLDALTQFCGLGSLQTEQRQRALACIQPQHRRSQQQARSQRLTQAVQQWYGQLELAAHRGEPPRRSRRLMAPLRPEAPACPQHPWAKAVAAVSGPHPDSSTIAAGIQHWQHHGVPAISLEHLEALGQPGLPGHDPSSSDGELLPAMLQLQVLGSSTEQWPLHLWLAQLPLAAGSNVCLGGVQPADAALHLQPLARTAADPQLLELLLRVPRVFDPKPEQVRLLRLLGVNAEHLAATGTTPGISWLEQPDDAEAACGALGLPNPTSLLRADSPGVLALGCSAHPGWLHPPAGLQQLPCFPPAPALSAEQARLLASWLLQCRRAGLQLVRLNPTPAEQELGVWQSLEIPTFVDPIAPEELLEELAWRRAGCPVPVAVHTPRPEAQRVWSHGSGTPAQAAICISSYNYADRIGAALQSCLDQSLQALELVVVDDASSDASLATIQTWLGQHGSRFCRALLLRHTSNGGLAAARNTAFAAAEAPWCFVLDADNTLEPQAVEHCLALALASPASTAVVHPLIRIVDAAGPSSLVGGGHAWQREQFLAGNMVDAMALIRRSAWHAVEGYSHIPGGWEDFDFWCKLITAQRHGVLCPEVLATYHRHGDSMLQSHTNRRQRQLSRLLQHRHPWLRLQLAQPEA